MSSQTASAVTKEYPDLRSFLKDNPQLAKVIDKSLADSDVVTVDMSYSTPEAVNNNNSASVHATQPSRPGFKK